MPTGSSMSGPAPASTAATCSTAVRPRGLKRVETSQTRRHLFREAVPSAITPRAPTGWLRLRGVTRNNLVEVDVDFPLGVFTSVTGVSGSGKSSLVSQALVESVAENLGHDVAPDDDEANSSNGRQSPRSAATLPAAWKASSDWSWSIKNRLAARRARTWRPIRDCSITSASCSRQPRRRAPVATTPAGFLSTWLKADARHCQGEGFVMVELLFLPSVYAPCPTCHGARYNAKTLEIKISGKVDRRCSGHDGRRGL